MRASHLAKLVVVTGGTRGIGRAVAAELLTRGVDVAVTGRDQGKADAAAAELTQANDGDAKAIGFALDVSNGDSVKAFATALATQYPQGPDALLNNAGVFLTHGQGLHNADEDLVRSELSINTVGQLLVTNALLPALLAKRSPDAPVPRVVFVSSGLGQLSEMGANHLGYRMSKAALNALMRSTAAQYPSSELVSASVCPGFVATDMTRGMGSRTTADAAQPLVWMLLDAPADDIHGCFMRDRKPLSL